MQRTDFFLARIKVKCFEGRATDALEEYFEPRVSVFSGQNMSRKA